MIQNKTRNIPQLIFFAIVLLCALLFLAKVPRISLPLIFSYILVMIIRPLKPLWNDGENIKTIVLSIILTAIFLGFAVPLVMGVTAIIDELSNFQNYIPRFEKFFITQYEFFNQKISDTFGLTITKPDLAKYAWDLKSYIQGSIIYFPKMLSTVFEWSLLVPLFVFFMLKDGHDTTKLFFKLVPNVIFEKTYYLFHQFNKKFGDYVFAKFFEATIVGLVITIGLTIMGYPFALLLGLVAGFTNILPYIGPIIGYIPALVIALVDPNLKAAIGPMSLLYLIANIVDLAIVFPLLVSKIVNLHPIIVVLSVIVGSQLAGVMGMILSIPLAAFFQLFSAVIYREVYGKSAG
jgi:putative permease